MSSLVSSSIARHRRRRRDSHRSSARSRTPRARAARAASPIARRAGSSPRSRITPSATAAAFPGGTTRPVRPCSITSGTIPTLVATTGLRHRHGLEDGTSVRPRRATSSRIHPSRRRVRGCRERQPVKVILFASPSCAACDSSRGRRLPSPTITNRERETDLATSAAMSMNSATPFRSSPSLDVVPTTTSSSVNPSIARVSCRPRSGCQRSSGIPVWMTRILSRGLPRSATNASMFSSAPTTTLSVSRSLSPTPIRSMAAIGGIGGCKSARTIARAPASLPARDAGPPNVW